MNANIKIKELRERKGLSQEELCESAGISLRTVQRIESGESVPRGSTLKNIALSLDVPTDYLTQIPEEKNEENSLPPATNKRRGFHFPWYIFGFTIIGGASGFLAGMIMTLTTVLPRNGVGSSIVFGLIILAAGLGMVTGKGIEDFNKK